MMLRRGLFWYSKPNASSKTSGILSVWCFLCAGKWRYVVYWVLLLTQMNFHCHSHCDFNTEMGNLMTQLYSKWLKITEIQGVWSVRWSKPLSASLWVGRKHFMGGFILLNCHLAVPQCGWYEWVWWDGHVQRGLVRGLVSGLVQRGLVQRGWYEWVGLGWRGGGWVVVAAPRWNPSWSRGCLTDPHRAGSQKPGKKPFLSSSYSSSCPDLVTTSVVQLCIPFLPLVKDILVIFDWYWHNVTRKVTTGE